MNMPTTPCKGSTAVRATKRPRLSDGEPWQKFELFPTPPWATRALPEVVLPALGVSSWGVSSRLGTVLEPAAGLGHMSDVLIDYGDVIASDIHLYSQSGLSTVAHGVTRADFLDHRVIFDRPDWIITNPPFGKAQEFLIRALSLAKCGVALLLRMQWLETEGRYSAIFCEHPPTLVAQFAERVPMCEGGWDPKLSTATAYAWFVWSRDPAGLWRAPAQRFGVGSLDFFLIPPGQKKRLSKPADRLLATRCVPGFVPPSILKKVGKAQATFLLTTSETSDVAGERGA